jgi:hypothetical protein
VGSSSNRNDLDPTTFALAFTFGDDAAELNEGHVHHATIARVHGLKGNDLAQFKSLLAQLACHLGQVGVAAASVALRVDEDVTFFFARSIHHAMSQELQCLQNLPLLADDATRVWPYDLDADLVGTVCARPMQLDFAIDLHVFNHMGDELKGEGALFVGGLDDFGP